VELPDHFILTETIRECLEESTDAARMEAVLRGLEDGSIHAHSVDSIAPSVFAHRLLLAWDYSFLDDGERANRRSRTVQMNRGMAEDVLRSEDLSEMLSREAVDGVVAEITGTATNRRARTPDELCELIRTHGGLTSDEIAERVRGDGDAMRDELRREGRIVALRPTPLAAEILVTAEDAPLYTSAHAEAAWTDAIDTPPEQPDPDASRDEIVRRAFKTSGPVTPSEMAQRLHMSDTEITGALTRLEASGAIFRGHFTSGATQQWCDRYVLQRIHRETLAKVRAEIEPCDDHEYAAFLMRWHHIGGVGLDDPQTALATVLDQLSGLAFTPEMWERSILPARVPGYRPELLDLLCLSGQFGWVALPPEDEIPDLPAKVAFVNRLERFLFQPASDDEPADAKEAAIWRALVAGGAQYLDQVADRAEISERDALAALWKLAARGRVSNDSFAPLRMFAAAPDAARLVDLTASRGGTKRDAAMRARLKSSVSGRWSALVAPKSDSADAHSNDRPRELAMLLLHRHGIVAREVMNLESVAIPWAEIQFALRRLEYGGTIRRGWFVRSLSGEQYALPEAVEMLRATRGLNPAREKPVAMSAIDPANPYGAMLKGCGVAREASNIVVIRGGRLLLALVGRAILTAASIDKDAEPLDDESFSAAAAALMTTRGKLHVDTIDEVPALESSRVGLLAAMRFHSDGRSLIFDGLPGPAPMRARPATLR
jgi:ATP-dependent Lhr-like helicase